MDFIGAKALTVLNAKVSFSCSASLLNSLSNIKMRGAEIEITHLQKQKHNATAGVAVQKPDLDAICAIHLIC